MADIQPYVKTLFLRNMPKVAGLSQQYARRDEAIGKLTTQLDALLDTYGVQGRVDTALAAERLFDEMLARSAFNELTDDFAGRYYRPNPNQLDSFRQTTLSQDSIHGRAEAIGERRFFSDVFHAFLGGETAEPGGAVTNVAVPASDRIVSLSHNQRSVIEPPLSSLIEDVRADNEALPDGVKERLLGQLRAGQELMRSGSVRAYLLYYTLLRGLVELAARYRGRAIAIAAEELVKLLIDQIFSAVK